MTIRIRVSYKCRNIRYPLLSLSFQIDSDCQQNSCKSIQHFLRTPRNYEQCLSANRTDQSQQQVLNQTTLNLLLPPHEYHGNNKFFSTSYCMHLHPKSYLKHVRKLIL